MKTNYSEIELINGPNYQVNKTPFVDDLSKKHDVVVQYIDQVKDSVLELENSFESDEIDYALYEETTEKGGGGEYVSHILYDPFLQSAIKFLVLATAEWAISKVADIVFERVKQLLKRGRNKSTGKGIYFILKVNESEHWFYFNSSYTDEAVDLSIKLLKKKVQNSELDMTSHRTTYIFDYSSKQWIEVGY